jgi:hypothetical protein
MASCPPRVSKGTRPYLPEPFPSAQPPPETTGPPLPVAKLASGDHFYMRHYTDLDNANLNVSPRPKFKPKVV